MLWIAALRVGSHDPMTRPTMRLTAPAPMLQQLACLLSTTALIACGSQGHESAAPVKVAASPATAAAPKTEAPVVRPGQQAPRGSALDLSKPHPFMKLKAAYQVDWRGEERGNAQLDGQHATIRGRVFGKGHLSKVVDGKIQQVGVYLSFRGGTFPDPDFGFDVQCVFDMEQAATLSAVEGDNVTVRGTIARQEITIEPGFTYTTLILTGCAAVP